MQNRWPFRLHATYDESIERFLNVFEDINRDIPFDELHWFFDHAETIGDRNLERVKALGGGIAIQHRMAFQGEYCAVLHQPAHRSKCKQGTLSLNTLGGLSSFWGEMGCDCFVF